MTALLVMVAGIGIVFVETVVVIGYLWICERTGR